METWEECFNLKYDKVFVSILNGNSTGNQIETVNLIYIFHNEEFTQEEIDKLLNIDLIPVL